MKTINHSRGPENDCLAAANNIPRMRLCVRVCARVCVCACVLRVPVKSISGTYCELLFSAASAEPETSCSFFPPVDRDGEQSSLPSPFFS